MSIRHLLDVPPVLEQARAQVANGQEARILGADRGPALHLAHVEVEAEVVLKGVGKGGGREGVRQAPKQRVPITGSGLSQDEYFTVNRKH